VNETSLSDIIINSSFIIIVYLIKPHSALHVIILNLFPHNTQKQHIQYKLQQYLSLFVFIFISGFLIEDATRCIKENGSIQFQSLRRGSLPFRYFFSSIRFNFSFFIRNNLIDFSSSLFYSLI
jgi:hypothetical protein